MELGTAACVCVMQVNASGVVRVPRHFPSTARINKKLDAIAPAARPVRLQSGFEIIDA